MIYDITTVKNAKETLKNIRNRWPNKKLEEIDYSDFDFVLEHITSNMDECKDIKLYGLKSLKTMLNEENNAFIEYCRKNTRLSSEEWRKLIEYYKIRDNNLCAFFSFEDSGKIYHNTLIWQPEIIKKLNIKDNEWKEKSKPYKITVNVNYDDLKFYIENHKINEMLAENIKNKIKKESIEKYDYVEIKRTVEPNRLRIEELK